MKSKLVLSIFLGILCLSIGLGLWISYYVEDSVGNNIFVLSFQKEHAFFTTDDIKFLNSENKYFTFFGKATVEISSKMVTDKVEIIGTNDNFADINKLKIISGSFFNEVQEEKLSNVVVISRVAAWNFFGYIYCTGNFIDINSEQYQVIGVAENDFVNKDKALLYIPFGRLENYNSEEFFVSDIFLNLNNVSEVEPIIKMMGYLPEDVEIFQMEQYKDIIMQRVRIIIFIIGISIIACFLKRILKNLGHLKRQIEAFLKENYAVNIGLLIRQKGFLFELFFFISNALIIFLILKIIQFKACLPHYFFSFDIFDLHILGNAMDFFIQPYIGISVLQYLNTLNLVSNLSFFVSLLSGLTFAYCICRSKTNDIEQKKTEGIGHDNK